VTRSPARRQRPGPEQSFTPASRQGALYPAVAAALALLLALALLVRGLTNGVSFATFAMLVIAMLLLLAGGVAAYWAWACARLRYELGAGVLAIPWGLLRHEAPVTAFERVVRGRATRAVTVQGLDWPGCHIGHATVPRLGAIRFLSLHRSPAEILYLVGPSGGFAISPGDAAGFIRALQDQMAVSPPLAAPRVVEHPALRLLGWRDQPVQSTLAASFVLALAATGLIFSRYAGFPDRIVVNFPEGARVAARSAVLWIPALAWLLLLLNGSLGLRYATKRRMAALTLLGGLTFVEAILVAAAITAA
jgi:hypothetical protein